MEQPTPPQAQLTEDEVRAYLAHHPDFFARHPELLETLTVPAEDNGEGVVDMRQYMLRGLQKQLKESKDRFAEMVDCLRDNMSSQSQIHKAIVELMKTHDLKALLQIIILDLPVILNLDTVHIALEAEHITLMESSYQRNLHASVSIAPAGIGEAMFGYSNRKVLLLEDVRSPKLPGMEYLFTQCPDLIQSAAIVRLHLERFNNNAILAFGTREKGRFSPHQGTELLSFLAEVIEHRLDETFTDFDPSAFMQ